MDRSALLDLGEPLRISGASISDLFHLLTEIVKDWEVSHFHSLRANEHSVLWGTMEVSLALHTAVILTGWLVETDAHPRAQPRDLWDSSHVRYSATPVV